MSSSKKVVHASVELVDIAGLVAGSSTGEGLGNRFLGGIREADAICLVLRAFEDPNVPGGTDPLEDLAVLELELVLADLATVETQLERRRKAAKQDNSLDGQVAALERGAGRPRRRYAPLPCRSDQPSELEQLRPVLHAHQQTRPGRGQPRGGRSPVRGRRARQAGGGRAWRAPPKCWASASSSRPRRPSCLTRTGPSCSRASASVRAPCPGWPRPPTVCSAGAPFSPPGDKESRAWTFRAGRQGAGVRRASSTPTSSVASSGPRSSTGTSCSRSGSWAAARDVGKLRVEGKEYEVVDGDVLEIRFNV